MSIIIKCLLNTLKSCVFLLHCTYNKYTFVILLFFLNESLLAQNNNTNYSSLIFSEVCVANIDQTIDFSNNYGAWVELYNPTANSISLDTWYISDDATNLKKHQLQGYGTLEPYNYICVFFNHNAIDGTYGPNATKQVRFKLNRKGGTLYLSKNGNTIDVSLDYPRAIPRCSYSRISNDSDEWRFSGLPTPGLPNSGNYAEDCLSLPIVDEDSKLFTTAFEVHAQIPDGTTLRYTTDGSTPTLLHGSTSIDGVFLIEKTTVLRMRLFADDMLPSGVLTRTYIYKDRNYYLPIVAVTTDPKNLYDNMIGCYTDGKNGVVGRGLTVKSNLNMDWVRPINFEYITQNGEMVINQETSFEVAGGYSRHFPPASFKVQAKKLYDGKSSFDYPIFVNKPYCEYKQLMIRNGGNNNRTDGGPRIKDAITQQVLTTTGFYVDAQEYQPVHVFINGKYLAMMNVREPSNRYHGVANYGYDDDEMDGFEYSGGYHQKAGTRDAFEELLNVSQLSHTDFGYTRVSELLDIEEFARYMAAVCYSGTGDWILNNNNLKAYRSRDNGKFHFVFFDQDLTWEKVANVIEISDDNDIIQLYRNIKRNKDFQDKYIASYCILHGSIYTPARCKMIADSICSLVNVALSYDKRYTSKTYQKMKDTMWDAGYREARMNSLIEAYKLTGKIDVKIGTNCPHANIQINGVEVPFNQYEGPLFKGMTVKVSSAEGYKFLGWKNQSDVWVGREKDCVFTSSGTYLAVFERSVPDGLSPICINEVSAANDIYVNDYGKRADWIELYNRGDEPIDVKDLLFSNESSTNVSYQIDAALGVNTIINPNEHLVIWCDEKPSLTQLHLPFKIKNIDNGVLLVKDSNGNWKDTFIYNIHTTKESNGRFPDGSQSFYKFYHPTIGKQNLNTIYDSFMYEIPASVKLPAKSDDASDIVYYTIDGRRTNPQNGIYIRVRYYQDGHIVSNKVVVKNGVVHDEE